jgi:hypothetical protein
MDRLIPTLLIAVLVAMPSHVIAGLNLRGKLVFENEVDSHECSELVRGHDSIAWVNSPIETSVGVIVRVCEITESPNEVPSSPGVVPGGVKTGWYVVGAESALRLLALPFLSDFSSPTFCRGLAAYWALRTDAPSSIILADLHTSAVLAEVSIGQVQLETDHMYHLTQAEWNQQCTSATFVHQGLLAKTVLRAKSN